MSIDTALFDRLNARDDSFATAWENKAFTPEAETHYQMATVHMNRPENPTIGDGFYRERGIFTVLLFYPLNGGSEPAKDTADAIRAWFPRGLTLSDGDTASVTISDTPARGTGFIEADRYVVPVSIPFYSNVSP